MMVLEMLLFFLRIVILLYDFISFPIYCALKKPLKDKQRNTLGKVIKTIHTNEIVSFKREEGKSKYHDEIIVKGKVDTLTKALEFAVKRYKNKDCLGTRIILGREKEKNADGTIPEKLILGEYQWMSYQEVSESSKYFGAALRFHLGQQPKTLITIFAETRAEWIISCFGSYTQNIGVGTVYTNLGDEGIIHAINETKTSVVVTSQNLLRRLQKLTLKLPNVKHIVYFEDQHTRVTGNEKYIKDDIEIHPFKEFLHKGAKIIQQSSKTTKGDAITEDVTPEDTAIVMYTSGSTGTPKGVVLTHKNLMSSLKAKMFLYSPNDGDSYVSYLPLAHVYELASTCTWILLGVKVGYSSPFTLTNQSAKVQKGCRGDIALIKPTIFNAVPRILERIYKNIVEMVKSKGPAYERVFRFCYQYKRYWHKQGMDTPILNHLLFNKIRALLGGRVYWICAGGAPVSSETQEFLRICLGAHFSQGYGLTESTAGMFIQELNDTMTNCCGKPNTGAEGRLVNWNEGNYKVTDHPNPRGEIILGGDSIAKGYLGKEGEILDGMDGVPVFFDEGGKRWFMTGDIGEYDSEGNLTIIDRKKDLVKLQHGEYVSLGKVEAVMKAHSAVENICVIADSHQTWTVALVSVSKTYLNDVANNLGITLDHEGLINDNNIKKHIMKELIVHGKQKGLENFEIPKNINLVSEEWTPESGLVTASYKIKRKQIQNHYQGAIDRMYQHQFHL